MEAPQISMSLTLVCVLLTFGIVHGTSPFIKAEADALIPFDFAGRGSVSAVYDVLERVLGSKDAASHFDLQLVTSCAGTRGNAKSNLCFSITDGNATNSIAVRGTSAVEIARGAAYYLELNSLASFSWPRVGGNRVSLPDKGEAWPTLGKTITKYRSAPISYFDNVVTFSYSYAWYTFEDWEAWLDWAVLSGINLQIAYTGQEEIYRKTFNRFGVNDSDFAAWSNGPGYLSWSRGQEMHGIASPLPQAWMTQQWKLQKQILTRSRSLGMVSVLPTFQGNLPPQFRTLFPDANITKTDTAWVDGLDPLFTEIQQAYMEIMISDWDTDHWYETDGFFNQNQGPWYSEQSRQQEQEHPQHAQYTQAEDVPADPSAYAHSSTVFKSMNSTDKDAIWFYQGWIWRGWEQDQLPFMKGFITGVPSGRFVMLDMFDEAMPEWDKFSDFGYFGAPYIWSVLHNFGGNTGMWGAVTTVNTQPFQALANTSSMAGTGAAPEGIDQNPFYYKFLTDIHWEDGPVDIGAYAVQWTNHRYGLPTGENSDQNVLAAWLTIIAELYNDTQPIATQGGFMGEKNYDGLTTSPPPLQQPQPDWYNLSAVFVAWEALADAAPANVSGTLRYDLVNIGREYLSKLSNRYLTDLINATSAAEVKSTGQKLVSLMKDADSLLCSEYGFVAGVWIEQARRWGNDNEEKDWYEMLARSQPTVWTPQEKGSTSLSGLHDYANKQWGGQVGGFYAGRTSCYINEAMKNLPVNQTNYVECMAKWSYEWTNDIGGKQHPICWSSKGDAKLISETLIQRYK